MPLRENQKHGLKRILGVMKIPDELTADVHDHRPRPAYKCSKRGFARGVAPCRESLDKLAIG